MNDERKNLMADAFALWLAHRPAWAQVRPLAWLLWKAFQAGAEFAERINKGKA